LPWSCEVRSKVAGLTVFGLNTINVFYRARVYIRELFP
jgi:hypothetical protein